MFNLFQAQYLLTHKNDPMDINGGVYVVLPHGERRFVRINHEPVRMPVEFTTLSGLFDAFNLHLWGELTNTKTLIHFGGYDDIDELYIFHEPYPKFGATIAANKSGDLLYSPAAKFLTEPELALVPPLRKLVFGHQKMDQIALKENLSSGNWEIIAAPNYLTFGSNVQDILDIAMQTGTPEKGSKSNGFLSALQLGKGFKSLGTKMSLHMVRNALFLYYNSKNERPFDLEYLEKVIDVQVANFGHEMGEITDVFEKLSRGELDQKHRALRGRTMKLPLAKENKKMHEISKKIGLNRYAYDYAFFASVEQNKAAKTMSTGAGRNLEREIDSVEEIIKASDPNQPWD